MDCNNAGVHCHSVAGLAFSPALSSGFQRFLRRRRKAVFLWKSGINTEIPDKDVMLDVGTTKQTILVCNTIP